MAQVPSPDASGGGPQGDPAQPPGLHPMSLPREVSLQGHVHGGHDPERARFQGAQVMHVYAGLGKG